MKQLRPAEFDFHPVGGTSRNCWAFFGRLSRISVINPSADPFQILRFKMRATSATAPLTFNFRDDFGFLSLDGIRVSVPEPATVALLGIGLAGLGAGRPRKTR
jgi:hypothetical protein